MATCLFPVACTLLLLLLLLPSHQQSSMVRAQVGFPHTAQLGRLPGTAVFRNVKQYPEAQQYPGILAVRIDAPLYYANVPVSSLLILCLLHCF